METIALDSSASAFSPDRPWSDGDEAALQETIDDVYGRFLKLVSKSRKLTLEQVKPLAGGRVWSGSQAKLHGLVDELGGLDEALAMISKKSKLEKYKVIHRPEPASGLDLFQMLGEHDEDEILMSLFSKESARVLRGSGFSMTAIRTLIRAAKPFTQDRPTIWALHPAEIKVH